MMPDPACRCTVCLHLFIMTYLNDNSFKLVCVCHVILVSWMNDSGHEAEYPGTPDGLATHSVISSHMIS